MSFGNHSDTQEGDDAWVVGLTAVGSLMAALDTLVVSRR